MSSFPLIDFLNTDPESFSDVYVLRQLFSTYGADKFYTPSARNSAVALVELRGQILSFVYGCTKGQPSAVFINYCLETWRKNLDRVEWREKTSQIYFQDKSTRLFEIILCDLALFLIEGGIKLISKITICKRCGNFYLPVKMPNSKFCSVRCRMRNHRQLKKIEI